MPALPELQVKPGWDAPFSCLLCGSRHSRRPVCCCLLVTPASLGSRYGSGEGRGCPVALRPGGWCGERGMLPSRAFLPVTKALRWFGARG